MTWDRILALLCIMSVAFGGCSEDEKTLSELMIGSWRSLETIESTIVGEGYVAKVEMSTTTTFHARGGFDQIATIVLTLDDGRSAVISMTVSGSYAELAGTVVFRGEEARIFITPPKLRSILEPVFLPLMDDLKASCNETCKVAISGDMMLLDGDLHERI